MLLQENMTASRSLTQTLPSNVAGKRRKGMGRRVIKELKTGAVSWSCTVQQSVRSLRTFQETRPAGPTLLHGSSASDPRGQGFTPRLVGNLQLVT